MSNEKAELKIVKADKAGPNARQEMAVIFAEGFTQWLSYFSKDPKIIAHAFSHMFILEQFYVALSNNNLVGMVACTDGKSLSVKLDKKELKNYFGFFKGTIASQVLKKEFENADENFPAHTASIEFVGTSSHFRGQGVGRQIIQYIFENTPYHTYLIEEVADTNTAAMNLYKKLGFEIYRSKPLAERKAKKSGVNHLLSLKYIKNQHE